MFNLKVNKTKGKYAIILCREDNQAIKKIAECYEEDYAYTIAGALAKQAGGKVIL